MLSKICYKRQQYLKFLSGKRGRRNKNEKEDNTLSFFNRIIKDRYFSMAQLVIAFFLCY